MAACFSLSALAFFFRNLLRLTTFDTALPRGQSVAHIARADLRRFARVLRSAQPRGKSRLAHNVPPGATPVREHPEPPSEAPDVPGPCPASLSGPLDCPPLP